MTIYLCVLFCSRLSRQGFSNDWRPLQEHEERQVCKECRKLCRANSIVRAPLRFARKYFAANLLTARLFQGPDDVEKCMQDMQKSKLWTMEEWDLQEIANLNNLKLQEWVGTSFRCDNTCSDVLKQWMSVIVTPALRVNVASIPPHMQNIVARFMECLHSGQLSSNDRANLKVAAACASGQLDGHPLVIGLALQCRRKMEKASRGIQDARGRRSKETPREAALIADAGLQLALNAGNSALAVEFGLSARACRVNLQQLEEHGLPMPGLALLWGDVLKENWRLMDRLYTKAAEAPKRTLVKLGE